MIIDLKLSARAPLVLTLGMVLALVGSVAQGAEGAKRRVREAERPAVNPDQVQRRFLPDWPVDGFDWFVRPVAGFKYESVSTDGQDPRQSTTVEGGLGAGVSGIPVVPGNPGVTVAPDAGLAYGYVYSVIDREDGDDKVGLHFQRRWLGVGTTVYAKFFRYRLDLRHARLAVTEVSDDVTQSQRIGNDFGVLVLPWLSQHYSVDYLRAYRQSYKDKFLEDFDHWLHTRMSLSLMSLLVDFGPGFTQTEEFDPDGGGRLAKGRTDYVLLKSGFNPFWKLVAEGQAKYSYHATEEDLGNYATIRLPEDELNEPDTLAMPEDSFFGSLFVGVKDIAYGLGLGWRTNIQILNVQRRGNEPKKTTKTQGLGLYAAVRF